MRMVRLVLFDIDGTLVRTGGAGMKAFARVFETEFKAWNGFEKLSFSGRTDFGIVREFFTYHDIPATAENFQRFFERYVFWLDLILKESQTAICPGVMDFIHGLQALAEPPVIGLLTGNIRLGAEIKLRHFQIWDYFVTGGFADDHEDRDQIAAAARERGRRLLGNDLREEEVVVIGDTPLDIRCGRAIGARVLAVATGGSTYEELEPHKPDWLVRDLRSLSAEEVVREP
jgi:phosphoglycolate phosphatase-like HAD superfamily hydrolase